MSSLLLPRSVTAFVAAAAVAVPVAGCGAGGSSAGGDPGADPAAFVPASAPAYVEAQIRPDGALAAGARTVAGKLLRTGDPGGKIVDLLENRLKDSGATYAEDVAPWLGSRAGIAVTGVRDGSTPDLVAAIVSKDDDAAGKFVDGLKGTQARKYRDVGYRFEADGDLAAAVVDHVVLIGTERGFKSAIDARSGDRLAGAGNFKEARATVGTDGLGFLYADPARIFDLALGAVPKGTGGAGGAQASQALKGLLAGSGIRSVAASLDVAADAVRVDAAVIGMKTTTGAGDGPGAAAAVPAGSWLSLGVGDVGGTVERALAQFGTSGGSGATGGLDPAALLQGLQGGLGVDVQKDFLSWMGDAALFVRGTTMDELGGALVVQSKDAAKSKAAITTIRRLLQTFGARPKPLTGVSGAEGLTLPAGGKAGAIQIAAKGDRFVIAYGPDALKDALAGGAALGDSAPFKTAAGLLEGAKPSLFLDTPQVVKLLGARAPSRPGFAKAKPALEAFGPAAAAVSSSGDVTRLKVAVQVP
ncbi:MAG TPA: DUF3352 domain-containing protein [Baekduia sp.]|uniref:DUF3352 domain-containing protein n=1 Tax=Baekduia sp. TaxID=2600305 RepID=UPI002C607BB6|nr:DUF3352 domain-containing protein [Baekduia sp.]HMJ34042.1 DUF3352 domain-containing protein [Baekduia sp.]